MKNWQKNLLFILSLIPLAAKFPYIVNVWIWSPLESGDPLMWMVIPVVAVFSEYLRRKLDIGFLEKPEARIVGAAFAFALAAWCVLAFKINAAGVILGVVVAALAVDLRFGRAVFSSQVPTFFFAILACPSVSFWLDYYLDTGLGGGASYLAAKFSLALAFLFVWTFSAFIRRRYPRMINVVFYACICVAFLYNRAETNSLPAGAPLMIDEHVMRSGDWIARRTPVTPDDKRFFVGCSRITRMSYFNSSTPINYLGLLVGRISNIHPIGICLKSAGIDIVSSRQIYLDVKGRKVQVNELETKVFGDKYMVYSWFSNSRESTGDFRKFRTGLSSKGTWEHYQIMLPADGRSVSDIRRDVVSFMDEFGRGVFTARVSSTKE